MSDGLCRDFFFAKYYNLRIIILGASLVVFAVVCLSVCLSVCLVIDLAATSMCTRLERVNELTPVVGACFLPVSLFNFNIQLWIDVGGRQWLMQPSVLVIKFDGLPA